MKCPNCSTEIEKFADICPNCKIDIFEYGKTKDKNQSSIQKFSSTKTTLLKWINILQIFGLLIATIISCQDGKGFQGLMYLLIGIISFAFIKGFTDIIELLDNINEKIK